ncbi:FAD-dependent oxidoreductase [Marinobacter sp. ELB17]|uniref:FAD-dependent oxidoreductase n=1 Tax=Marinobacter sp. ELB17 TaxID=270374 RepID=UPI0000F36C3C|nr:FAD-dependent oxidoreductase [Marinobacter sp. ELB17]EBA01690.1 2-octaprenyl-3-methyl-6-methoxy-1,4-benzoquinol hydroxylase [Marinobacter sp. ELB17]
MTEAHSSKTPAVADIMIVGGGMVGSALALGLAQQGWQVVLVESSPLAKLQAAAQPATGVDDFEPRVSAVSMASQRLLEGLGAWAEVAAGRHCPYQTMTVWDAEGTGRIEFDAAEMRAEALGTIVENRHIVRSLFNALEASPATIFSGAKVAGWLANGPDGEGGNAPGICLEDGQHLRARLVVAADGAQSRLRQLVGLPTREWDYDQQAIVATVRSKQVHQYTARQSFSRTGPLAFLPLQADNGDEHFCSIVWSQDTLEARRLMALDDVAFNAELARAIELPEDSVEAISRRFAFPLRQRHAMNYTAPGFALVGDAAHSIHPLAGQGANLGYGDVAVLLEELKRARKLGLNPGDALVLGRYQRRRKSENLTMMAAMEGLKQLFGRDELPLRWLRNQGMNWLNQLAPLKNRLAAEAMGLRD